VNVNCAGEGSEGAFLAVEITIDQVMDAQPDTLARRAARFPPT